MARKIETITLYISEILYDLENRTFLTGRSRQTGDNHELVANMQASEDEENRNQLLRSIGNAYGLLRTKLSEFIVDSSTTDSNTLISATSNFSITLTMPSNYNQATLKTITAECNDYIENIAILDWFQITNKGDASDYATKAGVNIQNLREALNKRVRPNRTAPTT